MKAEDYKVFIQTIEVLKKERNANKMSAFYGITLRIKGKHENSTSTENTGSTKISVNSYLVEILMELCSNNKSKKKFVKIALFDSNELDKFSEEQKDTFQKFMDKSIVEFSTKNPDVLKQKWFEFHKYGKQFTKPIQVGSYSPNENSTSMGDPTAVTDQQYTVLQGPTEYREILRTLQEFLIKKLMEEPDIPKLQVIKSTLLENVDYNLTYRAYSINSD